ncbi:MAG: helix-turn-helix domain-containing protein [Lachnospiraceae bacterium]|nr:helix-turn-helix domain-containing protein [Lachnospiraceae bacterium]
MISTQILKNCIEELHGITKIDMSVYNGDGELLVNTAEEEIVDEAVVKSFIDSPAESQVVSDNNLLKMFDEEELGCVVVTAGGVENSFMAARIAVSQIRMLTSAYKEKFDRNNFIQNLLMDNLLLVDVYNRAKKLHVDITQPRVVYVVESGKEKDSVLSELLKHMFTSRSGDFVTAVDENSVIVVKTLERADDNEEIYQIAQSIVDTVNSEAMINVRVGYGTVASEIKDVSKSYKEAMMAVDVGKIFYEDRKVNSYNSLGIGRLIYQLPPNLCHMFIEEIFGENDPANFDEEIVSTIYKFFENNLNVSETARQLFIHRNTLVYRVEKLKSLTGLDVRVFDDALTFMIAMMVNNYLKYLDRQK